MTSTTLARLARRATFGAGLASLLFCSGACAQYQEFISINAMVWFDDFDDCSISAGDNSPTAMTIDVEDPTQFTMGVLVSNNLSQNSRSNTGIDDTQIRITEVEVTLSFAGGGLSTGAFTQTVPNFTLNGGSAGSVLVFVGNEVTQEISGMMNTGDIETLEMSIVVVGQRVAPIGKTESGRFESEPSVFPFSVCKGCLTACTSPVCGMWQAQMPPPDPETCVFDGTTDTGTDTTDTTTGP